MNLFNFALLNTEWALYWNIIGVLTTHRTIWNDRTVCVVLGLEEVVVGDEYWVWASCFFIMSVNTVFGLVSLMGSEP